MEAEIKEKKLDKANDYPKDDLDYAYRFASEITKEVGKFVKGVVLFGSHARKKQPAHDIDILVILDDISIFLTKEFVQTYRIVVQNLVAQISKRLHITTFKYTSFWEFVRNGDPIALNILRDGVPIVDREFFRPLQLLLLQGRRSANIPVQIRYKFYIHEWNFKYYYFDFGFNVVGLYQYHGC